MPIDVFVAYVDTYIGKQLLRQFEASPHLFTVYGCTWSSEAARELNMKAAARQQQLLQIDGTTISTISPVSTARDHDSQVTLSHPGNPHDLIKAFPFSEKEREKNGAAALSVSTSLAASQGTKAFVQESLAASAATGGGLHFGGVDFTGKDCGHGGSLCFFSRQDVSMVRSALASCEWIVVEQRQSQEVLDMLSCVQQGIFDRPKKFVLLSSFMTWYATPPLTQPETEVEAEQAEEEAVAAAAAAVAAYEGIGAAAANEEGEEENPEADDPVGDDVNAPYPPPPEPVSDADEDDKDNPAQGDGDEEEGEEDGKEVLTEDQYNRRVPHVKYYNWRDAEKAVAAAHYAGGLPLSTYVVFAGLPYGEGEDLLEPFFREAWSGSSANDPDKNGVKPRSSLPIYGDGNQRVPMIHVRDLATFTRKLLYRPASSLPSRYVFATDGVRPTWRAIMGAVNHSFGDQCELVPVSAAAFPLHHHVEQFTIDMRVERGTMAALMEEMLVDPNEGDVSDSRGGKGGEEEGLWVAEGGLRKHAEKVALEFCQERRVTPLRIVLQGPPLAGKRFAASRLSAFYRIPHFSIEDVVAAYKACLAEKKAQMENFRRQLLADELARRRTIRKRRVLNAFRNGKKLVAASEGNGKEDANAKSESDLVAADQRKTGAAQRRHVTGAGAGGGAGGGAGNRNGASLAGSGDGKTAPTVVAAAIAAAAPAVCLGPGDAEAADEPDASLHELTEAEVAEAEERMAERFESSARVARWRNEIGQMERVLLMRMRVPPSQWSQSPSPGEDGAGGAAGPVKKRAIASAKSKKLTKEQQRKKEEEELLQAKEALKDAPFQDKALAIMLRWRLDHADCRTQGYILHGFPRTVEQARLAFGSEPLAIPSTEEEALNPVSSPSKQQQPVDEDGEEGEVDPLAGLTTEPSDEHRLPDFVLVLEAPENFLLDRLAAVSELKQKELAAQLDHGSEKPEGGEEGDASPPSPVPSSLATTPSSPATKAAAKANAEFLQRFHDHLYTFKNEFMEAAYTLLSYWECAVTEPGNVTAGGRRADVHLLTVHGNEPLVPPPLPASAFERVPPCKTELAAREIIGAPHFFGRTPLELHREEVRKALLLQEQQEAEKQRIEEERQRDAAAYNAERQLRETVEENLLETKKADLAALEERKAPLRAYLMESVIPLVSKALIEVAATRPENPLEYLSEWLMRHNPNNDVFLEI